VFTAASIFVPASTSGRSKHTRVRKDDRRSARPLTFPVPIFSTTFTHIFHTLSHLFAFLVQYRGRGPVSRRGDPSHAQSAVPARRAVLAHARAVPARDVPIHSLPCAGTGAVPARAADRASTPAVQARARAGMLTRVCRHGRACWHGSEPCQHSACQHRLCPVPAQHPCRHGPQPVPARPPSKDGACAGMHSGVCWHGRLCRHRPSPCQRRACQHRLRPVPAREPCRHGPRTVPARPPSRHEACAAMLSRVCQHSRVCRHRPQLCQLGVCQHRPRPVPAREACRHRPDTVPAHPPMPAHPPCVLA
jgi:hypothetical protein